MATNFASAQYQEIIDLHTESDKVSVIGFHTPQGNKPRAMLEGFFKQFRKYKYNGCSLVMVPAARLPADPLGVSYEAGEPGSDPRDLLNPILFHGCHGDNLNAALNTIYKGSFDLDSTSVGLDEFGADVIPAEAIDWESHYYRALSDRSFQKSNIMSAFRKKGLHPLVYNVASNHQILPSEDVPQIGKLKYAGAVADVQGFDDQTFGSVANGKGGNADFTPQFMTNRLQSLGWMDTKQVLNGAASGTKAGAGQPVNTVLPKIFMGIMMLPPVIRPRCISGSFLLTVSASRSLIPVFHCLVRLIITIGTMLMRPRSVMILSPILADLSSS